MNDENPADKPRQLPARSPGNGDGSGKGGGPTRIGSGDADDDDEHKLMGILSPKQWQEVQAEKEKSGDSISVILHRLGFADEHHTKKALELQYGVNFCALSTLELPAPACLQILPEALMRQYELVPVAKEENRVTIAMVNPNHLIALDDIKIRLIKGMRVKLAVCTEKDFQSFMERVFAGT